MTTAMLDRPHHPAHEAPHRGSALTGTLAVLRLYLRRDRVSLPLWVFRCPYHSPPSTSAASRRSTPPSRPRRVRRLDHGQPAATSALRQIYNDSLGAIGIGKPECSTYSIAVAVILTVIRHTRADEETGRAELIDSTAVGRYASLTAALLLSFGRR